ALQDELEVGLAPNRIDQARTMSGTRVHERHPNGRVTSLAGQHLPRPSPPGPKAFGKPTRRHGPSSSSNLGPDPPQWPIEVCRMLPGLTDRPMDTALLLGEAGEVRDRQLTDNDDGRQKRRGGHVSARAPIAPSGHRLRNGSERPSGGSD